VGAARMNTDILARQIVTTSGMEACLDVLKGIRQGTLTAHIVELMACEGGCINGPVMRDQESMFVARQRILEYAARRRPEPLQPRESWPVMTQTYTDCTTPVPEFNEEQIREIMRRVDKYTPEDELNCGACGYATCREKAVATLRGMAEATMCIPYMRRRAESLRQVVMDVTPNAILIVDTGLHIQEMSVSAETMLNCHFAAVRGKPLQTIMPVVDAFARVRESLRPVFNETVHLRDDLIVEQTIVPVHGQSLMLGILRDVTDRERQNADLEHLRKETLSRTQEVVRKQMRVAQEIAQLLGETTAETKIMLSRPASLLNEDGGDS
jgi:uncharacterized Fe-S cluster-containing protein